MQVMGTFRLPVEYKVPAIVSKVTLLLFANNFPGEPISGFPLRPRLYQEDELHGLSESLSGASV
jgi:hypothetical protein